MLSKELSARNGTIKQGTLPEINYVVITAKIIVTTKIIAAADTIPKTASVEYARSRTDELKPNWN